ncbi:MAG: hypothetical protein V1809_02150 [Planctomycetota bacterium]
MKFPQLALCWILVATPLSWGVYKSVKKSMPLFTGESAPAAPAISLPATILEAIAIAQQHVKDNNIDVSKHDIDSVRVVRDSQGSHWLVTWRLKVESDGGEIFALVGNDKSVKIMRGH